MTNAGDEIATTEAKEAMSDKVKEAIEKLRGVVPEEHIITREYLETLIQAAQEVERLKSRIAELEGK
jgi:acetylglutamate kinase